MRHDEDVPDELAGKDRGAELQRLCREIGRDFHARASGVPVVPLQVRHHNYAVAIEWNSRGVKARTEFGLERDLGPASRAAIALALLSVGGAIRMVRPVAWEESGRSRYGFEAAFASLPTALELERGLEALATACRTCGRESTALEHEDVAGRYLAVRCGAQWVGSDEHSKGDV